MVLDRHETPLQANGPENDILCCITPAEDQYWSMRMLTAIAGTLGFARCCKLDIVVWDHLGR